jgi:hypothetical protein
MALLSPSRCVLLGLVMFLGVGCAGYRFANDVRVPGSSNCLYVPVFVDETTDGRLGLQLADGVAREIFARNPRRLAAAFEDGCLAVDGTVLSLRDRVVKAGEAGRLVAGAYEVVVTADIRLVDPKQKVVAKLGRLSATADFATEAAMERTEEGRNRALARALKALSASIVDAIDRKATQS